MMDRKTCMGWYIWETCDKKKRLTLQKDMVFSTDRYKDKNYDGPFAVEFQNVAVAGR